MAAAAYLASAGLVVVWLIWGAVAATRACRHSENVPDSLREELVRIVDDGCRVPRLLVSSRVKTAVALGLRRPTILLPAGLLQEGSPQAIRAILTHEWAHIRNGDLWLLALGRCLLVLLFPHPLLWWLRRAIRGDQELLADAAAAGDNRPAYAEELLRLVHKTAYPSPMAASVAVGIWESSSQLSRRIAMLLDENFRVEARTPRRWRYRVLGLLAILGAACSLLTLQPARLGGEERQPAGTEGGAAQPATPAETKTAAPASDAQTGPEARRNVAAAPDARRRLAQSLAAIQSAYDATRQPGQVQRRHLWQVGEALPWRSTLQPSCKRQGYELKQMPQPWPAAADAPALRALLTDKVPGIRALAAEALATLHQPEDVSRLAALLNDHAEATMELQARLLGQRDFFSVGPGPDAVTGHTWHNSNVASHAAWGLDLILGNCCPEAVSTLSYKELWPRPVAIDPSLLASLASGDPKDHLWYWQEYIHCAIHQVEDTAKYRVRPGTPGYWSRLADEQERSKEEWMKSFFVQMRAWPAERRAMVRLLASNVHQGGADMAYYDTPRWLLFKGPLELGLEKDRILELLDGIRLWPDGSRFGGTESQVVERLAMGWQECFTADDVPRLLSRFSKGGDRLGWAGGAALVVALSHLMPTTGTASDDQATAEGFLRHTLKENRDVFIRVRAASELMRMSLDVHSPFLKDRFFADREDGDYLPSQILEWFEKAPAGDGPTRKLIELVSDDRYRPLWLELERNAGKAVLGGKCRRYACKALNARIGRIVVTEEDLAALKDPEKGPARLPEILARVRDLAKP
jgi:hypothetical protein